MTNCGTSFPPSRPHAPSRAVLTNQLITLNREKGDAPLTFRLPADRLEKNRADHNRRLFELPESTDFCDSDSMLRGYGFRVWRPNLAPGRAQLHGDTGGRASEIAAGRDGATTAHRGNRDRGR